MIVTTALPAVGGYTLFRIVSPLLAQFAERYWLLLASIGIASIFYGSLCILSQTDLRRMIAYLLVVHSGLVLLGVAVLSPAGFNGTFFIMLGQCLYVPMLLFLAGIVQERFDRRELDELGGLGRLMPRFSAFAGVALLTSLGAPGFCGFVGQVLVLLGCFQAANSESIVLTGHLGTVRSVYVVSVLGCIGTFLLTISLLLAMRRLLLGTPRGSSHAVPDLTDRETGILTSLTVVSILLGIFPTPLVFALSDRTMQALIRLHHSPLTSPAAVETGGPAPLAEIAR